MSFPAHLWTIAPHLWPFRSIRGVPPATPWTARLRDEGVTLTGLLRDRPGSVGLVVILHGLAGCAESRYVQRAARAAEAVGLSSLRMNFRGADRRGQDYYHGGLTSDLQAALSSAELQAYERIFFLGYSLGGHLALRWATEWEDPRVRGVAAVSSPLDLSAVASNFDRPSRFLYRRWVMADLHRIYGAVATHQPVPLAVREASRIWRIREWDERVVAPRFGFLGAEDYYRRVSVGPRLAGLKMPALLVLAEKDPLVPADSVQPWLGEASPLLEVRWARSGGHVSFPESLDLGLPGPKGLEAQILRWLLARPDARPQ